MATPTVEQIKKAYPGYVGWNDPNSIIADYLATGGQGKGGSAYAVGGTPTPSVPQPQTFQGTSTGGYNPNDLANILVQRGGYNPTDARNQAYNMGGRADELAKEFGLITGAGTGTGTTGGGGATGISGFSVAPAIDLPAIYSGLYQNLGIQDTEAQINGLTQKYYEARAKISDNPFLSASMIDQRLQRLDAKYKEQTQPLLDAVAQKKADVETQMNLQIKQFDINSQQAKDALNYFNTLLEAGALDNASGTDIANITRATGISSAMIQSAISSKKKEKIDTQLVTSTADDGTVTASLINTQTGEVIKQSDLGRVGNQQTGDKTTTTEAKEMIRQDIMNEAQAGATWDTIYQLAVIGGIDPRDAYNIYVSLGRYHPDTATQKKDLERYGISQTGYSNTTY